jgi:hypothetical protein
MIHLSFFLVPAVVALVVLTALLHEHQASRRRHPRTDAEKRAMSLLRSWLTPEQDQQWTARGEFDVIGSDTGTRYRITYRAMMNVHQLDEAGRLVTQWCFTPAGNLAPGDVLLAQKIALETMEREALALANSQRLGV